MLGGGPAHGGAVCAVFAPNGRRVDEWDCFKIGVNEMASVTAIIPVKNRVNLLERAIDSVLGQSARVNEIIVVDDGSNPTIESTINKKYLNDIYILRLEKSINAAAARNLGVDKSGSDFIAFLDSDDEWRANHIEGMLADAEKYKSSCEFFVSPIRDIKNLKNNHFIKDPYDWLFSKKLDFRTTGFFIKKGLFIRFGGFDPLQEKHQDWDFALRLGRENAMYYRGESTILIDSSAEQRMSSCANINASHRFLEKHEMFMEKEHIAGFIKMIASHACLNKNSKIYNESKELARKYNVNFGRSLSGKVLWFIPVIYPILLNIKLNLNHRVK